MHDYLFKGRYYNRNIFVVRSVKRLSRKRKQKKKKKKAMAFYADKLSIRSANFHGRRNGKTSITSAFNACDNFIRKRF